MKEEASKEKKGEACQATPIYNARESFLSKVIWASMIESHYTESITRELVTKYCAHTRKSMLQYKVVLCLQQRNNQSNKEKEIVVTISKKLPLLSCELKRKVNENMREKERCSHHSVLCVIVTSATTSNPYGLRTSPDIGVGKGLGKGLASGCHNKTVSTVSERVANPLLKAFKQHHNHLHHAMK